jgi:hypothetical protein
MCDGLTNCGAIWDVDLDEVDNPKDTTYLLQVAGKMNAVCTLCGQARILRIPQKVDRSNPFH